jgi:hypothetical protein
VLEKIVPADAPTKPVCLAGERRCPPEDVGGPSGYEEGGYLLHSGNAWTTAIGSAKRSLRIQDLAAT